MRNRFASLALAIVFVSLSTSAQETKQTDADVKPLRVSQHVIILSYSAQIRGMIKGVDVSRKVAECSVWHPREGPLAKHLPA